MNPEIINLGFISIRWYSALILIGFIVGYYLVLNECNYKGIQKNVINDICFNLVIISIIGARLYYCLFNLDYYGSNLLDILKIWEGGLAIHGGVIAGIIWTYLYSKKHNIKFLLIADIMVISLILGQAIGRWGNFFNQEAHGPVTTLIHLQNMHVPQFVIDGMFIKGAYYEPTFFYESIWCVAGFIFMIIIRLIKKIKLGMLTSFYLIWYGIGRFYIESLRTDSLMLGSIKVAQLISVLAILSGITILILSFIKKEDY